MAGQNDAFAAAKRDAEAVPPFRPPFLAGALFTVLPRPEPVFLPPPVGTGIGASTIDPLRGDTPNAEVLGISAAAWWILSGLIALFVGGWTAARLAGIPRQVDGMLHGLLAWSLSTLVVFYFVGTVVGGLIGGTFNLSIGSVAAVAPQVADAVASETDLSWENIRQEARQLLRQTGNPDLQPEALERRAEQASGAAMSDQEIDSLLGRLPSGSLRGRS